MFSEFARQLTGPLLEKLVWAATARGELPEPTDDPHVHAMGPDPDRILMIGAGAVAGIGVTSFELGLGGHVARQLSALTGRGADVEIVGHPGMTPTQCARILSGIGLARFDAVVVMVGGREALSLRSPRAWRRDIRSLVATLEKESPVGLATFVIGVPPLPPIPLTPVMSGMITRQVLRLNAETEDACRLTRTRYVPFAPAPVDASRYGDTNTYAGWADPIVRFIFPVIEHGVAATTIDEDERLAALYDLRVLDTDPDPAVDAVARVAKDLFGVMGASINLIDRDRQWMKSSAGIDRTQTDRDESFCTVMIAEGGMLVVEDALEDPRFRDLQLVRRGIRFYAGYPIEAPQGERVGSLCLVDTEPRAFTASDASLLRELALRVQGLLWEKARTGVV